MSDGSSKKNSSATTASNRKSANASAPSEQELKEEEELQLALALSLSETPTKFSFPDLRQFQEPAAAPIKTSNTQHSVTNNDHLASNNLTPEKLPSQNSHHQTVSLQTQQQPQYQHQQQQQQLQPSYEYNIPERDSEVFYFVAEVQSTLEVFNNRLNACKLRNRPITNDSAIQSLFLKLNTETQPKLSEFIKTYEEERAGYERLQDKLSQISDARAALDALREEHQEKMRQLAAEAERQRQGQLASKLEAMRQKKSQMMQYQRELALQRIREQEMLQQPQQQQLPPATVSTIPHQQQLPPQQSYSQMYQQPQMAANHPVMVESPLSQQQSTSYQDPSLNAIQNHQPQHQIQQQNQTQAIHSYGQPPQPPSTDYAALARFEQQYLPKPPKPDEDTPLISFDD